MNYPLEYYEIQERAVLWYMRHREIRFEKSTYDIIALENLDSIIKRWKPSKYKKLEKWIYWDTINRLGSWEKDFFMPSKKKINKKANLICDIKSNPYPEKYERIENVLQDYMSIEEMIDNKNSYEDNINLIKELEAYIDKHGESYGIGGTLKRIKKEIKKREIEKK